MCKEKCDLLYYIIMKKSMDIKRTKQYYGFMMMLGISGNQS